MSSCRYMPFVKLDCKMLDSSLWPEKDQRDLFITALLMAEPIELTKPTEQLKVRSLDPTGFEAPPGWYGFVPAAGIGIINRCGMDPEKGLAALERLGDPDPESRSNDFEGRRLIRIDGGYLTLNYDKYRERDYSNADRCKRYRDKKKKDMACQSLQHACQHVSDMQAEAEAEAEELKKKEASPNGSAIAFKIPIESKDVVIPRNLLTLEFVQSWNSWIVYRKKKKKSGNWRLLFKIQLEVLEKMNVSDAIKAIEKAEANGWLDPYPPKEGNSTKSKIRSSSEYNEILKEKGMI